MVKDATEELAKNSILLQKKTAELLVSVNALIKKMDSMVDIFTKAANYIEKEGIREPMAAKLSDLLEQNKRIAKGLLMLEKYVREKSAFAPQVYGGKI